MQIKRIQCPKCGVVLEVKNSKNEEIKLIICPRCRTSLQVKFPHQQEPIDAYTYYPQQNIATSENGATKLAFDGFGATQLITGEKKTNTNTRLVFEDKPYFLEEGQNIIGRQGNTSKATVQIVTEDRYMSRQHCAIKVTTLPDGTKKAVLSNFQNKNTTSVDGQEIETGDEIRLTDGNRITMGHTTVVFKL